MKQRDVSTEEILLEPLARALTFDQLVSQCLPALTASIWATCSWPESISDGWKIGDFNFLVLAAAVEQGADICVQFWSEPRERVCAEVTTGGWSGPTWPHDGPGYAEVLASRGFEAGGLDGNFQKELAIASPEQAEAMAHEALTILYEAFQFRGQGALTLRGHRGERADLAATYAAVTPEDFAKLASAAGFDAVVADDEDFDDTPVVLLQRHRRKFTARLEAGVPGNNLYAMVTLQSVLSSSATDDSIHELNATLRFQRVHRDRAGDVLARMTLSLAGGVTAHWLTLALREWVASCRECENILKRRRFLAERRPTRRTMSVH